MKYERIEPIDKTRAKKLLANGDRDAICRTLVSVAMFESDRRWAQSQFLKFAVTRIRLFAELRQPV